MSMHVHSLQAYHEELAKLSRRQKEIYEFLLAHGPLMDRECLHRMFPDGADMNMVRPRITELVATEWCIEIGSKYEGSRCVRIVKARTQAEILDSASATPELALGLLAV